MLISLLFIYFIPILIFYLLNIHYKWITKNNVDTDDGQTMVGYVFFWPAWFGAVFMIGLLVFITQIYDGIFKFILPKE
jgi:hypothetical protein